MWGKLTFLLWAFVFEGVFSDSNYDRHVKLATSVSAWNGSCAILPCTIASFEDIDYYMWYYNPKYDNITKNFNGTIIYQSNSPSELITPQKGLYIGKEEKDCTIVITNLQKEDTGYYQVRLIGKRAEFKWMSKSNLSLSVSHTGPSLKLHEVPTMQENQEVILTCSIDYYCPLYEMSLTWLQDVKGEVNMYTKNDTSAISMTATLTFVPSWEDHNKNINCVLQRKNEEIDSRTIQLDVKYAPQNVKVIPEGPIKLKEGTQKNLTCSVESSNPPNLKITWYKDKKKLKTQANGIQCKEAGKYHCTAENSMGTRDSNTVEISVLHRPKNVFIQKPPENIKEGYSFTLNCSTVANPPVSRYIWYKNGRERFNSTDSHYSLSSVTEADSGDYKCKAINDQGNNISPPVQLDVKYAPRNVKVIIKPDKKQFHENTEVTFECIVNSSNPEVTRITWYRNNEPVDSFSKRKSIQAADAGTYKCEADNGIGKLSSDEVSVEVLYPPKNSKCIIVNGDKKKEGEQVTLECRSQQSNPIISSYQWFKDNKLYKTINSNSLQLTYLRWNDAGNYSCKAINAIGSHEGHCKYLSINYSPKNVSITVSPGNSVTENTKVQLSCTASAGPNIISYSWYRNNQPLPQYQKEYALENIELRHAGDYLCVVQNNIGSSRSPVISLHVSYSSFRIGMYAASAIVSFIILVIFVALIVHFGSRLKTCRKTNNGNSDLSFFVLKKAHNELSDQQASSEDSLNERISYASLQFPASSNGGQSQPRPKASQPDPDPDPNDIYSVVKKPTSTAEYENIESSKKTQEKSDQDDIHYSVITNLNRGTTVRERGPETEYAMLKQ